MINVDKVWRRFQQGVQFNSNIDLVDNVKTNENFYVGKQWEGVRSNGLPTPVFNFLKQIVQHQVASITTDNLKMNATPLRAAANDQKLEALTSIVNDEFAAIMERTKLTTKLKAFVRNAAVDGDGCIFCYWDADNDMIQNEVLQNTRVYFGNPNDPDVQSQPWIIIARREPLKFAKQYAEDNGCDPEAVRPDSDENNSDFDAMVNDKVTHLLYLKRDKDTKTIHAYECTRDAVLREEYDMEIRLYPLVWMNWDFVQDNYHGQALITGLIPNQQFVNKAYAMSMMSLMMSAFPKIVYDKNRVTSWTNAVGAQIGVNGDVTNIARVLEGAQISPQVSQFISQAISDTQNFTGATAAALGNTRPDNTSAIIALQRAASIPSELPKQNEYQCIEDLGRIWVEFMIANYGKRIVDVSAVNLMDPKVMQFAGVPENQKMQQEFDFATLRDLPMYMNLDVGASAYWSEIASMQTLDNLLQLGQIDITDYLERIPDGYIAKRQELLDKYKMKMAQPMAGNPEGDIAPTGEEEEITGGSGNREIQRQLVEQAL